MSNPLNPLEKQAPATPCLSMKAPEAAKALGISERTLWDWTAKGIIPHFRQGRIVLYSSTALSKWIEDQSNATAAAARTAAEAATKTAELAEAKMVAAA